VIDDFNRGKRSPDERSDIRGRSFDCRPAYRFAHAGYLLLIKRGPSRYPIYGLRGSPADFGKLIAKETEKCAKVTRSPASNRSTS
jgi:hypothetical protein